MSSAGTIKNIAILSTALAGSGKAIALSENISDELSKKQLRHSLILENWPLTLVEFTDVWIVGGDGTLNYFINHYPDTKLPLVIFNGGTGNDFHWLLYGNVSLNKQLEIALSNIPMPIDIGKCNERYFINGVGIGFEGDVTKALTGKKKRPGITSFFITVLKKIFSYHSKHYSIKSEEHHISGKKLMVDICNGSRVGAGFHIAPVAKPNDGLLNIVIADPLNSFQRLIRLPVIEKGKHLSRSYIQHFLTKKISVESNETMQAHLDGEYMEALKFEIEILPDKVFFRV